MNPSPKYADLWGLIMNWIQIYINTNTKLNLWLNNDFYYGQPKTVLKEGSLFKFRETKSTLSNNQ